MHVRLVNVVAYLPMTLLVLIVYCCYSALKTNPNIISGIITDTKLEVQSFKSLEGDGDINQFSWQNKVAILHVWATWCHVCKMEHAVLDEYKKNKDLVLLSLSFKDYKEDIKSYLLKYGNPYNYLAILDGEKAIELGVYATPETFIVDKKNHVRYHHQGPITSDIYNKKVKKIIDNLLQE